MKLGITLMVLGILGGAQYIYFQFFTLLAYDYEYSIVPYSETLPDIEMVEVVATKDWTVGIIGLLIGLVLLCAGVYRLIKARRQNA